MNRSIAVATLAASLLLSACAGAATPAPAPVTVRMVLTPFLSNAPFFVAQELGFFAEQGLQIETIEFEDAADAIPALAQGRVEVVSGFVSLGSLNAIARGSRLRFVADRGYNDPSGCAYSGILARRSLAEAGELDDPAQWRGRRVAADPVGVEGYLLDQILKPTGQSVADLETVDLRSADELHAFEAGALDLTLTSEPWITRLLEAGHTVLWRAGQDVAPEFQLSVIVFGPSLLDENPEAGRRFILAYLKAVRQLNEGKTDRNVESLARHTELDEALVRRVCWPQVRDSGRINAQSILDFQAWATSAGYLDSPVPEEQFWDPGFVDYAAERLESDP